MRERRNKSSLRKRREDRENRSSIQKASILSWWGGIRERRGTHSRGKIRWQENRVFQPYWGRNGNNLGRNEVVPISERQRGGSSKNGGGADNDAVGLSRWARSGKKKPPKGEQILSHSKAEREKLISGRINYKDTYHVTAAVHPTGPMRGARCGGILDVPYKEGKRKGGQHSVAFEEKKETVKDREGRLNRSATRDKGA